ncbi:hypothetical protein [Megasphaera sueciensis]|uniref:hypothetical protein n=1 Tax=Megasphaera sueciensis TaxID=349094 RepID=UPI003D06E705
MFDYDKKITELENEKRELRKIIDNLAKERNKAIVSLEQQENLSIQALTFIGLRSNKSIEEMHDKYRTDVLFNSLVSRTYQLMNECGFTEDDIYYAAILALEKKHGLKK